MESSKCLKAPITLSLSREYPCSYDFHVFVFFILHFFTITYSKNQCSFFLAEKNQCFQKLFSSYFIYNFFFFGVNVSRFINKIWFGEVFSKKPNLKIVIQIYCENVKMKTSFKCFSDFGFCVCWVIVWTLLTI